MSSEIHAMVLTGAGIGSTASYEVGVMKALVGGDCDHLEAPVEPGILSGGTFGALNAAFMASPRRGESSAATLGRLEKLWLDSISSSSSTCGNGIYRLRTDPRAFLDLRCLAKDPVKPFLDLFHDGAFLSEDLLRRLRNLVSGEGTLEQRIGELVDLTDFFSVEPFHELLSEHFDLGRIRRSEKVLRIAATNWSEGTVRTFTNSDMTDADGYKILLASAAFLLLFPPVEIGDTVYAGAGASTATPLRPALDAWLEDERAEAANLVVHVVFLDPKVGDIPFGIPSSTGGFSKQVIMQQALSVESDIAYARRLNDDIERVRDEAVILKALKSVDKPSPELERAVARLAERQDSFAGKRSVTLHYYRPRKYFGAFFELLNFDRRKTRDFIDQGYEDTIHHDCDREGCTTA